MEIAVKCRFLIQNAFHFDHFSYFLAADIFCYLQMHKHALSVSTRNRSAGQTELTDSHL